eukprot:TRINITY_DN4142_c0_g1_i3.p1 TRINITY_DN4142_c0_g1~~TRINITY_DN4142_c0_g1_i3.p1  ORF type:complete len:393 (-),score=29.13 TRINITY_DN4142_c0_g1_i3:72-1250(-)
MNDSNAQIWQPTDLHQSTSECTGVSSVPPVYRSLEGYDGRGCNASVHELIASLNPAHGDTGPIETGLKTHTPYTATHSVFRDFSLRLCRGQHAPGSKKHSHTEAAERAINGTLGVITLQQLLACAMPCGPDKNTTANANGALRIFVCSCRSGNCLGGLWAFKLFSPEAGWATYQLLLHIAVVQIGPDTFRVTQTNDPRSVLVGCAVVRNQVMLRGQEEVWELSIAFERSTFVWTAAWQVHQHDSGSWRLRPTDVKAEWPVAVGPAPTLWLDTRASAFACGYRRWRCRVSGPFLCTAVTGIFCVPKLATFMAVARAHRDMFPVVRRDGCGLILRITALACRPLLTEEDAATILEALGVAAHTKQHEEGTPVQLLCAKVTALRDFIQAGDAHQA